MVIDFDRTFPQDWYFEDMDETAQAILDSLPVKPPAAELAPYRELICEMRRRGWSCREIAQVLAEKCGVHTTLIAVYDVGRKPARAKPRRKAPAPEQPPREPAPNFRIQLKTRVQEPRVPTPRVQEPRVQEPKEEAAGIISESKPIFVYNENEPLRFMQNSKTE